MSFECPNCKIKLEAIAVEATEEQTEKAKEFADKVPGEEEPADSHEDDAPGENKTQPDNEA